jgi:hypothetical protein
MKPGALEMRRRLPAAREAGAGCSLLGALVLKPQRMRKIWQTNHTCYAKVRGSCTRTISLTAYHTLCDMASTNSATSLPWNASHSLRLLGCVYWSRNCDTAHPVSSRPIGPVTQRRRRKGGRPLPPLPSPAAAFVFSISCTRAETVARHIL